MHWVSLYTTSIYGSYLSHIKNLSFLNGETFTIEIPSFIAKLSSSEIWCFRLTDLGCQSRYKILIPEYT